MDTAGAMADRRSTSGYGPALRDITALLPTPAVNDMGAGKTVEDRDAWTARMKAEHGNGNGNGNSLHIEALRMLPTPTASERDRTHEEAARRHEPGRANGRGGGGSPDLSSVAALLATPSVADVEGGRKHRSGARSDELLLNGIAHEQAFGQYAPAIARWETVLGRPAPAPTEPTGKGGAHRLSPRFVEWLMGLPVGWVTDTATSRNEQLKALGNGVVPQQAAAAIRHLLGIRAAALAGQVVAA